MTAPAPDHGKLMADLERLLADVEALPDAPLREKVRAVVRAVLDLHGAGLAKVTQLLSQHGATGFAVLNACAQDPLVHSLLLLHDLHPSPFADRVATGLSKVDTFLKLNGSSVELVSLADSRVKVKILSNPAASRTSPDRLKGAVEQALVDAAPDAAAVEIDLVQTAAAQVGATR